MVQADVVAFLESGCNQILAKPLRREVLVEAMRKRLKPLGTGAGTGTSTGTSI